MPERVNCPVCLGDRDIVHDGRHLMRRVPVQMDFMELQSVYRCRRCNLCAPRVLIDELRAQAAELIRLRGLTYGYLVRQDINGGFPRAITAELAALNVAIKLVAGNLRATAGAVELAEGDLRRGQAYRDAALLIESVTGLARRTPEDVAEQLDLHMAEVMKLRAAAKERRDWSEFTDLTLVVQGMLDHRRMLVPDDEVAAARAEQLRGDA
jgi:hypothetical protein